MALYKNQITEKKSESRTIRNRSKLQQW